MRQELLKSHMLYNLKLVGATLSCSFHFSRSWNGNSMVDNGTPNVGQMVRDGNMVKPDARKG
jgi:hypothetical protein